MKHQKNTSKAFRRFKILIARTDEILKAGNIGISKKIELNDGILDKFKETKPLRGKVPKNYTPDIKAIGKNEDGTTTFEMDRRSALFIKDTMLWARKNTEELNNHLNSIMLVYIWGAFESYYFMLFEELFNKKIEMLKSSESISYKDVIENDKNIIQHLIFLELSKIGHFSLAEYVKYLQTKLNLNFSNAINERLKIIYFLRNLIAHNTGFVQENQKKNIPKGIKIKNNEILISKSFLLRELSFIRSVVGKIESHVQKKFSKNFA